MLSKEGYETYEFSSQDQSKLESVFKSVSQHLGLGYQMELKLIKHQIPQTASTPLEQDPVLSKYEIIHTSMSQKLTRTVFNNQSVTGPLLSQGEDHPLKQRYGPQLTSTMIGSPNPDLDDNIDLLFEPDAKARTKHFRLGTYYLTEDQRTFEDVFHTHEFTQQLETAKDNLFNSKLQLAIVQLKSLNDTVVTLSKDTTVKKFSTKCTYSSEYKPLCTSLKDLNGCHSQSEHQGMSNSICVSLLLELLKVYSIHEPNTLSRIYLEMAGIYIQCYQFNKAMRIYQHAIKLFEHLNWQIETAYCLSQIGYIMALYGFSGEAKLICYTATDMCKEKLQDTDLRLAECYHNLGMVCFISKDLELAVQHLDHSLSIKSKLPEELHLFQVKTLNQLGIVYHMLGLMNKSLGFYAQALELLDQDIDPVKGQILNNVGLAHIELGDEQQAQHAFTQALHIFKSLHRHGLDVISRRVRHNMHLLKHRH